MNGPSCSAFLLPVVGLLAFAAAPRAAQGRQVTVEGVVVERGRSPWIAGATVRLSGSRESSWTRIASPSTPSG